MSKILIEVSGPPGCGKTHLIATICRALWYMDIQPDISETDLSTLIGEERIREDIGDIMSRSEAVLRDKEITIVEFVTRDITPARTLAAIPVNAPANPGASVGASKSKGKAQVTYIDPKAKQPTRKGPQSATSPVKVREPVREANPPLSANKFRRKG